LQVRVFSLTWLSYASYYLCRKHFSVTKATLEQDLDISVEVLGSIDTAFLALYALGQFINGALGDRVGARRMIGLGMILSALSSLTFGLSESAWVMGLAFGLNGLFQSTGWPNNVKAMAPWFSRHQRGAVMGIWCTNYQVGGLVATLLAGWLLANYGWRWAFHIPAVWVATVGALVLLFLVERPQDRGLPALEEPPEDHVARDAEPDARVGFAQMIRIPALWALGGSYFGLKLIRYSLLFWLPYYLSTSLGYAEDDAAYLSIFFEIGGIVGVIGIGWISDRFFALNRARLITPVLLGLAASLWLYQYVAAAGTGANAMTLALIGFLLFGPDALISGAAAQDIGGEKSAASAAGIINGLGSIGSILAGVLPAWLSKALGWDALFYVFIGFAILSAVALLPLGMRKRSYTETG
jgi:sugar phosphate permease